MTVTDYNNKQHKTKQDQDIEIHGMRTAISSLKLINVDIFGFQILYDASCGFNRPIVPFEASNDLKKFLIIFPLIV